MRFATSLWAAAVIAAPAVAHAQMESKQWIVTPRGGLTHYSKYAGIKNAPFVGVDAAYYVTPMFALGTTLAAGRSNTRGDYFLAALNFGLPTDGDTTDYFGVTQPVTVFDAALNGTARMTLPFAMLNRFSPFITGGVGVYTLYLNPQVSRSPRRHSAMSANFGGGIDLNVGKGAGIQLAVRDLVLNKFRRSFMNPTDPRFTEIRFNEDIAPIPPAKSTIHNLQVSLGFSFRPSASDANTGDDR